MRVLVPEAHAMGSLGCIRSLGRAGHHVIAMADRPNAIGFLSRFCCERIILPRNESTSTLSAHDLAALIDKRRIDFVIPSEGLISALGDSLAEFSSVLPVGPDPTLLLTYTRKFDLFEKFLFAKLSELREHLPPIQLLSATDNARGSLADLALPVFAKVDAVAAHGVSATVKRFTSQQEAAEMLPMLLARHRRVVLQGFVPGQGVGVFFLRWNGRFRALLMHRRLHEVPHTGGVSSFRETWWHEAMAFDAMRRAEAIDWWGVGMFEYRWEAASDRFWLMEFNARFWGSIHLALFAGVDFPLLLLEEWSGKPGRQILAPSGVRCRYTFPKELEYLWSMLKDSQVSSSRKVRALVEFCGLSLDPRVHTDLWFPGDRLLYFRALPEALAKLLRR